MEKGKWLQALALVPSSPVPWTPHRQILLLVSFLSFQRCFVSAYRHTEHIFSKWHKLQHILPKLPPASPLFDLILYLKKLPLICLSPCFSDRLNLFNGSPLGGHWVADSLLLLQMWLPWEFRNGETCITFLGPLCWLNELIQVKHVESHWGCAQGSINISSALTSFLSG